MGDMLNKREAFREAFDGFDPYKVASTMPKFGAYGKRK